MTPNIYLPGMQGRPVLDRIPGSMSFQLDKLVEKNRALEALRDSEMDPAMAPLVLFTTMQMVESVLIGKLILEHC